jgi:high-affinity Fe2+/Pb2+ permease
MDDLERIAGEWCDLATGLVTWVMAYMVNRTDVWGRYHRRTGENETFFITAPFRG